MLDGEVVFVLKVYDLRYKMLNFWQKPVITKQCFDNIWRTLQEFIFEKYSKDIPKILKCYENVFIKWKIFIAYTVKLNIGSLLSWNIFLNFIETVFHWEPVGWSNVLKRFVSMLNSWNKFKIRPILLSIHTVFETLLPYTNIITVFPLIISGPQSVFF